MFNRRDFIGSLCAALMIASVCAAQSPAEPGADVSIALKIDRQPYTFNGKGECTYAPEGYIFGMKAQQWKVEGNNDQGSASLTLWRLAAGSEEMFSFYAAAGNESHLVNTVKTGDGGEPQGSGRVAFTPGGSGGTFTINATAATGATIAGTMKCSAFSAVVDEGG